MTSIFWPDPTANSVCRAGQGVKPTQQISPAVWPSRSAFHQVRLV